MKHRDLCGAGIEEPERHIHRAGVRALIVAMKPGNSGGAKGCRKMETQCPNWTEDNRWQCPRGLERAGERSDQWSWTEPTVWTERMLTALEQGVKGGKYAFFAKQGLFSLQVALA
jgi:hypothetical protein